LAALERLMGLAPAWRTKTSALRLEMRTAIEDKLGPHGVLLCPVFHRTAPRHGAEAIWEFPGFTYSAMLNPLELPSTSVPVGFGADGLPIGVQIAAARNRDALTLGLAGMLEQDLGGWVAPWRPRKAGRRPEPSVSNGARTAI
jgi:Asp-tRNA(Asn)/Glu-tRNA(Gln) amidotransferase A subunit family amidase